MYIAAFSVDLSDKVYFLKKAQIAHFKLDEACIKMLSKYADFVVPFLPKLAIELSKYTKINNYAIQLVDN